MDVRSPLSPEQQRAVDYLAAKGTHAPLERLRQQVRDAFASVEQSFDGVAPERRGSAPEGKWSPHQILNHLVLSHGPAVPQFATLLSGVSVTEDAIPADLQTARLPAWSELRAQLGVIHGQFLRLLDEATGDTPLEAKVPVVMVIKAGGVPVHWIEHIDWKAFIQAIRMHTLEHERQLQRALGG
jgi:AraC-like DNA-binding protein